MFLAHNAAYIDALTDKMEKAKQGGGTIPDEDVVELFAARKRQRQESESWRFAQYTYYGRTKEGNYYHGMINELSSRYWSLPNGMFGKFYGQYNGMLNSHFAGSYYDNSTMQQRQWKSRSYWSDSAYGVIGVKVHPLPFEHLYDFGVQLEYLFPINTSKDKGDDFRVIATYGKEDGDDPHPLGNIWDYYKAEVGATYSYKDGDVTSTYNFSDGDLSSGLDLRYGKTLVWDFDRNLLVIPHLTGEVNYLGRKKESPDRWETKVGGAIALKKFFLEDKYKTPQALVEVSVGYKFDLRDSKDNVFGINTTIEF